MGAKELYNKENTHQREDTIMIRLGKDDVVLFFGDSITHGGRGSSMDLNHIMGHGFQSIISSRLAYDNHENMPKFINKGVSGDTVLQMYSRLHRDVLPYRPSVLNILCGANDLGAINLPSEMVTRKYLTTMEQMLCDLIELLPDVKIILCEPFYVDVKNQETPYENIPHAKSEGDFAFHNRVREEEAIAKRLCTIAMMQKGLRALAQKYHLIFVPMQDLFDEVAKTTPVSYFIWDNIHPTMVGHEMMARRWFEVVEKHFE